VYPLIQRRNLIPHDNSRHSFAWSLTLSLLKLEPDNFGDVPVSLPAIVEVRADKSEPDHNDARDLGTSALGNTRYHHEECASETCEKRPLKPRVRRLDTCVGHVSLSLLVWLAPIPHWGSVAMRVSAVYKVEIVGTA
jgi:hypothetical protein